MPRVQWLLRRGRPCVEVVLTAAPSGQPQIQTLLADTGAGSHAAGFQLLLGEHDCLVCGGVPYPAVRLGGAYAGTFPIYMLPVHVPTLGFNEKLKAVGVPSVPAGFDGIACFRFLNRFTYGNFGDPGQFGLEA